MFFTHLGRVLVILGLILGVMMILTSTKTLINIPNLDASIERHFHLTIESSIYMVLGSIVLGILTDIRYALRAMSKRELSVEEFLKEAKGSKVDNG